MNIVKILKISLTITLTLSSFMGLFAKDIPFTTKGVIAALEAEVKAFEKKGIVDVPLPKFNESEWKVHVLAENEAISDVIEVSGKSLVYIGSKLFTQKLVIHGDGILFVNGELICPEIDIKGNAIVIFNDNKVKFYGGNLKIGSGLIAARKGNNLNIHIRKNGTLYAGSYNNGSIVANGQVTVHIDGPQKGDILLGKGATRDAKIFIAKNLEGKITCLQNCNVEVSGSLTGDVSVIGNLKIKAGDFLKSNMTVSKTLNGKLNSIVSAKNNRSKVTIDMGTLSIAKSAEVTINSNGDLAYNVGVDHLGNITTIKGNINASIAANCKADVDSGANANFKSTNFTGLFTVKENAVITNRKVFESYMLKTGGSCKLKTDTFKGNANVATKGDLTATNYLSAGFYHNLKMNSGSIKATEYNELLIDIAKDGSVAIGKDNTKSIKIGTKGKITIQGSCKGRIVIGADGDVLVKKTQAGIVNIGVNGTVILGKAMKSVIVVKKATINIGTTTLSYFDDSIISIGSGDIKVSQLNQFDVIATNKDAAASLNVGQNNNGDVHLAGKGNIKVGKNLTGNVKVIDVATYSSKNQFGKMYFGNTVKCNIIQKLQGNLYVADNSGKSYLKIGHIIDSNIGIYAWASIETIEALDVNSTREKIFLETGSLVASQNLETDFAAEKEVHVQARNIYGNVEVGHENSRVDAIVKGKMKIGL